MNGQENNNGTKNGRIRLTRELLLECANDDLVSYVGLQVHKPHVAAAIADYPQHRQCYDGATHTWQSCIISSDPSLTRSSSPRSEGIYRLDPAAKTGPTVFDVAIEPHHRDKNGSLSYDIVLHPVSKQPMCVALCLAHPDCRGFWYLEPNGLQPNGIKMLATTLDVQFGKLIGVRFEVE